MANYIAQRIIDGVYTYAEVITKRPDLQTGIDSYLTQKGKVELIMS